MNLSTSPASYKVAALYRFCSLENRAALKTTLASFCCSRGIKGTLLLAHEGINGTVAGPRAAIDELVAFLATFPEFEGMELKLSETSEMPFHRMKVRLKREIVTLGIDGVDPASQAGVYVAPSDWNALISDADTIVVDTRNDYEVSLGSFRNAVDPRIKSFRELPQWVEAHRGELEGRKVAMFCTGGIRCEKATSYLRSVGLDQVFHLKGGILKYLEDVPAEQSLWQGECFVFDERVSVTHGLEEGAAELCRACRHPLTASDRASPHYRLGVSCAYCADNRSDVDRIRYAERQRQVELAQQRGAKRHIGS